MRYRNCFAAGAATILTVTILFGMNQGFAQDRNFHIRIARLVIDPSKLTDYQAALKAEIDASIKAEPGVRSLYAVYDKNEPSHVTVFEIYANEAAYKSHIQTTHFKKYKETVTDMVKSLELVETIPIALGAKTNPLNL